MPQVRDSLSCLVVLKKLNKIFEQYPPTSIPATTMRRIPGKHFAATPLLLAVTLVPLLTFLLTYTISLTTFRNGKYLMEYPYYFLSSSIESKPASNFGTFGLSLSCAAVPLTAFIRHARVKFAVIDVENQQIRERVRYLNTYALKTVIVAAIAGVGVASFQSTTDACGGTLAIIGVHGVFALIFFIGGMRYCLLQHQIDQLVPMLGTVRERYARKWFARATVIQLVLLGLLVVVVIVVYMTVDGPALTPRNSSSSSSSSSSISADDEESERSRVVNAVLFVMSIFEISLLITFMSTFITFYDSFSTTSFAVVVMDSSRRYSLHEDHVVADVQNDAEVETTPQNLELDCSSRKMEEDAAVTL